MIKIENFNDVADCETIVSDEYKNCQAVTNLNEKMTKDDRYSIILFIIVFNK